MKKTNIILLCFNVGTVLALTFFWLFPGIQAYWRDAQIAGVVGYKPFARHRPFTIMVSTNYPREKSFVVGADGLPIAFIYEETDSTNRKVKIAIGAENEIGGLYTTEPDIRLLRAMIINNNECFIDEGANGSYDFHVSLNQDPVLFRRLLDGRKNPEDSCGEEALDNLND